MLRGSMLVHARPQVDGKGGVLAFPMQGTDYP